MEITSDYDNPFGIPALRLEYVPRWCIINTKKQQSVAEHSYNVATIAERIMHRIGEYSQSQIDEVVRLALHHDIDEAYTSDVPSPAKLGKGEYDHWVIKLADLVESLRWIERHIDDEPAVERWVTSTLRQSIYDLLDKNGLTYTTILKGLL